MWHFYQLLQHLPQICPLSLYLYWLWKSLLSGLSLSHQRKGLLSYGEKKRLGLFSKTEALQQKKGPCQLTFEKQPLFARASSRSLSASKCVSDNGRGADADGWSAFFPLHQSDQKRWQSPQTSPELPHALNHRPQRRSSIHLRVSAPSASCGSSTRTANTAQEHCVRAAGASINTGEVQFKKNVWFKNHFNQDNVVLFTINSLQEHWLLLRTMLDVIILLCWKAITFDYFWVKLVRK